MVLPLLYVVSAWTAFALYVFRQSTLVALFSHFLAISFVVGTLFEIACLLSGHRCLLLLCCLTILGDVLSV